MKAIHGNKLWAIMEMKLKALFSKNFIIMPIFSIGFTFIMKLVYGAIAKGDMTVQLKAMALSYGVLMNISMTGIYCVSAALAEEKEKHTLRVLMTSSVNGLEFFLGSLIPTVGMIVAVNIICVPVAGVSMDAMQWAAYLGVSILSAVTSTVIGMIFGIFAKNQVTAGTVTTPAILVLLLFPMLSYLNETLEKISSLLFTGVMQQVVGNIADGKTPVGAVSIIVMALEILIAVLCFLLIYRKNGYDSE